MGVAGLLGSLKSIHKSSHLREFRTKTVAVDAYGWLHRGAVACAIELATGKPTRKYVDFAMHRVRMLLHFGLTPYLVFDGDRLPGKAATEAGRGSRRQESKAHGLELLRLGRDKQAYQELQKAIDITPEMARLLIEELKRSGVRYVVAPYEADSQMVYLERKGLVDAIISEDSDLLVFGAQCLITKLDQYGECVVIRRSQFTACREMNLTGWTDAQFRCMAILSGCDYLEGIPRMGIKTAHRLVRKYKTAEHVIRGAQWDGKFKIPADYLQSHNQANLTFLHQWVYCPLEERLVHFTEPDPATDLSNAHFLGAFVEETISRGVAQGDLNPMTKKPIVIPVAGAQGRRPPQVDTSKQSDQKGNKLMDSFLQRKRTPLAELDPNSIRFSQHQSRMLDNPNNNRPWPADLAPPAAVIRSSPNTSSRSSVLPSASITPTMRQAKRPRLCAEDPDSPSKRKFGLPLEQSPFFARDKSQQTCAKTSNEPKRKQKYTSFELWSDDTVEGIMQEMSDDTTQNTARKASKSKPLAVYEDSPVSRQQTTSDLKVTAVASKVGGMKGGEKSSRLLGPGREVHTVQPDCVEPTLTGKASASIEGPPGASRSDAAADDVQASSQNLSIPLTVVHESPPTQGRMSDLDTTEQTNHVTPSKSISILSQFVFKGSEDAMVPESDVGSPDEVKSGSCDKSDTSEPPSPTSTRGDGPGDIAHSRRHLVSLERFVYGY